MEASKAAKPVDLAIKLPCAAATPIPAALAGVAIAGSAASTPSVKTRPGVLRESAPSTKESTRSCKILRPDRKSTRLNSSHGYISYAVFCLKKKTHAPARQRYSLTCTTDGLARCGSFGIRDALVPGTGKDTALRGASFRSYRPQYRTHLLIT